MRSGLTALGLLLTVVLTGCSREPAFDERFDDANASISASAAAIDAEILATDGADARPVSKDAVR